MLKRNATLTFFLAATLHWAVVEAADDHWALEAYGGTAYNLRNRLTITQEGGYSQTVDADYRTRPLKAPPYYSLRGARWHEDAGWEVSLIHHKLYLANPPAGTSDVSVSHGFNILSVNRAWRAGEWTYRLGAGPVVTHAEATINGSRYDGPYKLSGAALLAGGGRRFYLREKTYLSIEGLLSAAYANPTLPGSPSGELKIRNVAVHALFGIGHEF